MLTKKSPLKLMSALAGLLILAACGSAQSNPVVQPAATQVVQPTAAVQADQVGAAAPVTDTAVAVEPAAAASTVAKLNLNTATGDEFRTVPNVGDRMVREFNEYRPYASIQQFRQEIGKYVDATQVTDYEKYLFVPVLPNNADAATLQQLPGVDTAIAEQLIAARPYADKAAFMQKLGEVVTADQLAAADGYVVAE